MATTTVKVTDDWASRTTSVDNGPLPLESQVARADATHVQFIDVAPIGSESVTIEGLAGPAGFLHKPFTQSELIEKVVELLGDSATSASPATIQTSNHRNASS